MTKSFFIFAYAFDKIGCSQKKKLVIFDFNISISIPFILIPGLFFFYRNYMIWVSFCSSQCWLRQCKAFFVDFGLCLLWHRRKCTYRPILEFFWNRESLSRGQFSGPFFFIRFFLWLYFYSRDNSAVH